MHGQSEDQHLLLSDRDLLISVFSAIGALATRLTGERLLVSVPHPAGGYFQIDASLGIAGFVANTESAATPNGETDRPVQAQLQPR